MPAKQIKINLLGERKTGESPLDRILLWATTYGRYIMIGTEIIVLLAFISRFSLDRKITDLKEEISQKQAIIIANQDFENEVRNLQDRINKISQIINNQELPYDITTSIQTLLPPDVIVKSYRYERNSILISAAAGTTAGFSQFIVNLQASSQLRDVAIQTITKKALKGIEFSFSANVTET